MLDIFRILITFWRRRAVYIDSLLFRLHTRVTVAFLLMFSLIVAFRQYVWGPIACFGNEIPRDVLNAYCWSHTFTIDNTIGKRLSEVIHPGVSSENKISIRKHRYYQWVAICLFFQAVLFYFPKWLWSVWESGKVQRLKNNLSPGFTSDEEKLKSKNNVLEYLISNISSHEFWSIKYIFCEILTLTNVVGQAFLMDRFLGGFFWTYGSQVWNYIEIDSEDRVDPMIAVFPEITKCTFYKYGASGVVQKYDAICILKLNLLNQKIYVFLWFWSMFLITVTSAVLLVILVLYWDTRLRLYVMRMYCMNVSVSVLSTIVRRLRFGDLFLLYLLNKNVEPKVFRELLQELAQKISNRQAERTEFNTVI